MASRRFSQNSHKTRAHLRLHLHEVIDLRGRLNEILARHTGQTVEAIARDTDRDNFLSAEDAVKYGLVDKVLTSRDEAVAA